MEREELALDDLEDWHDVGVFAVEVVPVRTGFKRGRAQWGPAPEIRGELDGLGFRYRADERAWVGECRGVDLIRLAVAGCSVSTVLDL